MPRVRLALPERIRTGEVSRTRPNARFRIVAADRTVGFAEVADIAAETGAA